MAEINSFTLPNGLRVWHVNTPGAQSFAVRAHIKSGPKYEDPRVLGVSHFNEHLVCSGSELYPSRRELDLAIKRHEGKQYIHTGSEYTMYGMKVPQGEQDFAFAYLREMLFNARLRPADVEREREVVMAELKQRQDDPHTLVWDELYKFVWPKHPSAIACVSIGTPETVATITHADVVKSYEQFYRPGGVDLAVVGDLGFEQMQALVSKHFGDLPASSRELKGVGPPRFLSPCPQVHFRPQDSEQTHLILVFCTDGLRGGRCEDLPLELLSNALSNDIFHRFVYDLGISYSAYAGHYGVSDGGVVIVGMEVSPDKAEQALKEAVEVINTFVVTTEVLVEAAAGYKVNELLDLDHAERYTDNLLRQVLYYGDALAPATIRRLIDAVTPDRVAAAAEQLLVPERAALFALGPVDHLNQDVLTQMLGEIGQGK